MKKSITKPCFFILCVMMFLSLFLPFASMNVFATDGEVTPIDNTNVNTDDYDTVPKVNLNDAETKVEGKMWKLVELAKTIGKPVCIIGFIISILAAVFGAIGKKGATGGLIGAFVAAVAYICINYSTEIVLFIQTYFMS